MAKVVVSYHFQGTQSDVLNHQLKALKAEMKVWKEQVLGNVETKEAFSRLT